MDDRIRKALEIIEEWNENASPSGHNDIKTLHELKEVLSEEPATSPANAFLLENVAILSADLHTHKNYGAFYERLGPDVGGFPGVYRFVIEMAKVMTDWEERHGGAEAFEGPSFGSWAEASEKFVDAAILMSLKKDAVLVPSELREIFMELAEGDEEEVPSP